MECFNLNIVKKLVREFKNPTNLYSAQQPLFYLSFVCGLTPLKLHRNPFKKNGTQRCYLKVTIFGYIITFIHITIFLICFIITLDTNESIVGYFFNTNVSRIGDTLQLITGIISITIIYIFCLLKRFKIITLIKIIDKCDEYFIKIDYKINYKTTLNYILLILLVKCTIYTAYLFGCYFLLRNIDVYPSFTVWIAFFFPHFMISVIMIKFMCLVKQIRYRFCLINKITCNQIRQCAVWISYESCIICVVICAAMEIIKIRQFYVKILFNMNKRRNANTSSCDIETDNEELATPAEDKPVPSKIGISTVIAQPSTHSDLYIVDTLITIHDSLCDACTLVEQYFTVQMLTIVTIAFVIIVFNAYYVIEAIFSQDPSGQHFGPESFIAFFAYQTMMYVIAIFGVVRVGSQASKASAKTGYYVHKLLHTTNNDELKEKLLYFSLQLIHRKVKFTACGLFPLDRSLLFTIVGAATTYLIILFQFTLTEQNRNINCSQITANAS